MLKNNLVQNNYSESEMTGCSSGEGQNISSTSSDHFEGGSNQNEGENVISGRRLLNSNQNTEEK